ncbi:hypothetical protein PHISP_06877 [Aspergillus sp. HF37]|nr:hypothetical protein PHISP_06877 [Aspergillus sp. HF37]
MSTQSSTPITPKGPRNNRRNPKRNTTPHTQNGTLLTTHPSSPPRNLSPGGTATDSSNNVKSSKKNVRSGKKPRDIPKASPAYNNGSRHSSSQPNNTSTPQLKDSPHYAGPTFHASPAPSALPIPSFVSKPTSDSELEPALEVESDGLEAESDLETTPSKAKPRPPINNEPTSTPLDFLFKAAVEARNPKPQRSPEADARIRSPQTDSKAVPQRNYSGPVHGDFPLKTENHGAQVLHIGPSFAPSYKDRMNALRSTSSPSQPTTSHPTTELDEEQRRAKTEALKSWLRNSHLQQPLPHGQASGSRRPNASTNVPHFATPSRTTSGPAATISYGLRHEESQPIAGNVARSPLSSKQPNRTPQSGLRREVTSAGSGDVPSVHEGIPPRHASYNQVTYDYYRTQEPRHASPMAQKHTAACALPAEQSPQIRDTKKMEDDLRRILKLDSMPSGVQSSYA